MKSISTRPALAIQAARLTTRGNASLLRAPFVFALSMVRFFVLATFGRVDLLHIHVSVRGSIYRKSFLGRAAQLLGVPYIVHLHGSEFRGFWSGENRWLDQALERLLEESSKIIVMAGYWARFIIQRLPDVACKIVVVPNSVPAVPPSQYPAPNKTVRITFLGQLTRLKGVPELIRALDRLAWRRDWTATIAGHGEIASTRKAIQQLTIADRVQVPGWLDLTARDALLRSSDVLVLPSFSENFPMVIIEAFARGIAVISTPVGAIPEIIQDRVNGLLVPKGDVDSLSKALEALIEDPELRQKLGQRARRDHATYYDADLYLMRLANIWFEAAKRS